MIKISGVANVLITNPLWVVNSRIKMQGVNNVKNDSINNSECSQRKYKGLVGNNVDDYKQFGTLYCPFIELSR